MSIPILKYIKAIEFDGVIDVEEGFQDIFEVSVSLKPEARRDLGIECLELEPDMEPPPEVEELYGFLMDKLLDIADEISEAGETRHSYARPKLRMKVAA